MLYEYIDEYVAKHEMYKGGKWCYEDGLIYRGLELLHIETGQQRWLDHLKRLIDTQVDGDGSLLGYNLSDYNIDNVKSGMGLLYMHKQTGQGRYMRAAELLARQLKTHPRTQSGVFWHKLRYPWQIWLDGIYMGHPFRIAHAQLTGQPEIVADSLRQIDMSLVALMDPSHGLYKHAYDEAREQPWADARTGHSAAFWARAIGWLAMALVDVAELVGDDFEPLRARTVDLLNKIVELRQPNGLWLQVIDRPDLEGNYQESSASAMFTYALLKAARLGLVENQDHVAKQLFAQVIKPKAGGGQEMVEMCEVAGLGMYENRFRDGSPEYYLTEKIVSDDTKGVGPLMMAAALAGE